MTVSRTEMVSAVSTAVRTWGGHRRTPRDADLMGRESLTGCTLEVLGLGDIVPTGRPRAVLQFRAATGSPLALALSLEATRLLDCVCEMDAAARRWSVIHQRVKAISADMATAREAS